MYLSAYLGSVTKLLQLFLSAGYCDASNSFLIIFHNPILFSFVVFSLSLPLHFHFLHSSFYPTSFTHENVPCMLYEGAILIDKACIYTQAWKIKTVYWGYSSCQQTIALFILLKSRSNGYMLLLDAMDICCWCFFSGL